MYALNSSNGNAPAAADLAGEDPTQIDLRDNHPTGTDDQEAPSLSFEGDMFSDEFSAMFLSNLNSISQIFQTSNIFLSGRRDNREA